MMNNNEINLFDEVKKEIKQEKQIKNDNKVEHIQIILILVLIVVGTLVYFFGYEIFKPFIKID